MESATMTKEKKAPKVSVSKKDEIAEKVDALGEMSDDYKAAKDLIKEYDAIRAALVSETTAGIDGGEELVLYGEEYAMKISAAAAKREVSDKAALYDALGNDQFVELAKFGLGDLDKYLTPDELKKCVETDPHGGARRTQIVRR